jgi:ribonuclease R
MSLNVNKKTWCMSYYYDIDAITGDLINFNIKNEICEITGNLTYQQFDEYLNKGTSDSELFNTLVNLSNISSILKRIYNKQITFEEFNNTNQSESTKVVESAMIYTNYQTAKYFDKNDLPFMYRCHEKTNDDVYILNKIEENLRNKNQSQDIINEINKYKELMQKAYYTRHNIGHYGLGIKYYSHVTSPLRRLADVINSICIKKFYINKNFTKDDIKEMIDLIDEISEQINNKRNSCVDYEIQYLRLKNRV